MDLKTKVLITIDQRLKKAMRFAPWVILWLTLVMVVCASVPAFGEEPNWEVEISSVTCFTDHRFFDDWKTTTTARIFLDETKAFLNLHDLEVWSEGLRIDTFPASVDAIDISGIVKPSFKIVNRRTLNRNTLAKSPYQSHAHCSIRPPPDGAAWIWSDETNQFELRIVRHVDDVGAKVDLDLRWEVREEVVYE